MRQSDTTEQFAPEAIIDELDEHGIRTWLAGGWAEERHGLIRPRPHKDVDLLYPATSFEAVEGFIADRGYREINAKRFHHKRAWLIGELMVEVLLLEPQGEKHVTNFWSVLPLEWPAGVLDTVERKRIASVQALKQHRAWYPLIEEARIHSGSPVVE